MGMSLIDENGKREDGRALDELRSIKIDVGVLNNADGSAYVEWGKNKVLAAAYGPKEMYNKYLQDPTGAVVHVNYNMAAFSVDDRVRPGPSRRSTEISKIIGEALARVIIREEFPRASIDVFIEVLEASAGTRCAGLTAASVAVADAGIPMRALVASCAAGKVDGHIILDLGKGEDNLGQADLPVGYVPETGEITLLQMDGHMTREEFDKALKMAIGACEEIHDIQKRALKHRYAIHKGGESQ
jgi:exosome complex component RRP41